MKTVFTNDMVAHVWAQTSQAQGRSDSMRFDHGLAFSYAEPVANIITTPHSGNVALFRSRKFSMTTARHVSLYERAARQYPQFTVPHVQPGGVLDHNQNVAHLRGVYESERKRLMRVPCDSYSVKNCEPEGWGARSVEHPTQAHAALYALSIAVAEYCEAFGLGNAALPWRTDADVIIARRDRLANDPKAIAKRAAKAAERELLQAQRAEADKARRLEDLKRHTEAIALWRAGAPGGLSSGARTMADGSAMLRIVGDTVQTSQGAEVPLSHARNVFRFWRFIVDDGRTYAPHDQRRHADNTLGHFKLDSIDADGNVRAGCHLITRAELESFGKLLEGLPS
jgi:hypothetical protein